MALSDAEILNARVDYHVEPFTIYAAGTTLSVSTTSALFTNLMYRGLRLYFNAGAWTLSSTASASWRVQVWDSIAGRALNMTGANTIAFNPTACATFVTLTIYPGAIAVANEIVNNHIGYQWRIVLDVVATGATKDFIFGVTGQYLK